MLDHSSAGVINFIVATPTAGAGLRPRLRTRDRAVHVCPRLGVLVQYSCDEPTPYGEHSGRPCVALWPTEVTVAPLHRSYTSC